MLKTFAELYKEGCRITDDDYSVHLHIYEELDNLWKFVSEHPENVYFRYSLSSYRTCVVIPYEMFGDKRLPCDDITVGISYTCIGFEKYRSLIIDQMNDTFDKNLNKWKLIRLGKVVDMGWEEFCDQYLKNLL